MATNHGPHQHSIRVVPAIVLAIVSIALGIMKDVVPNVDPFDVSALAAPCSPYSCPHGDEDILTFATIPRRVDVVSALAPTARSPRIPAERFSGEGAGRQAPLSTSSADQRAFLLNSTAILRNLAHTGGCERTERPLGGTSRRCASTTEQVLVAVASGIVE